MKNKECKVVMLPTEKASKIHLDSDLDLCLTDELDVKTITKFNKIGWPDKPWIPQHLYIVSNEEIHPSKKDSELLFIGVDSYTKLKAIFCARSEDMRQWANKQKYGRLIATTDPQFFYLPRPSNEFIEAYCKAGGIDKVLVEYTTEYKNANFDWSEVIPQDQMGNAVKGRSKLKVAPDNTITIHKVQAKDSYTKEEVIELMDKLVEHIRYPFEHLRRQLMLSLKDEWIKKNLS